MAVIIWGLPYIGPNYITFEPFKNHLYRATIFVHYKVHIRCTANNRESWVQICKFCLHFFFSFLFLAFLYNFLSILSLRDIFPLVLATPLPTFSCLFLSFLSSSCHHYAFIFFVPYIFLWHFFFYSQQVPSINVVIIMINDKGSYLIFSLAVTVPQHPHWEDNYKINRLFRKLSYETNTVAITHYSLN